MFVVVNVPDALTLNVVPAVYVLFDKFKLVPEIAIIPPTPVPVTFPVDELISVTVLPNPFVPAPPPFVPNTEITDPVEVEFVKEIGPALPPFPPLAPSPPDDVREDTVEFVTEITPAEPPFTLSLDPPLASTVPIVEDEITILPPAPPLVPIPKFPLVLIPPANPVNVIFLIVVVPYPAPPFVVIPVAMTTYEEFPAPVAVTE